MKFRLNISVLPLLAPIYLFFAFPLPATADQQFAQFISRERESAIGAEEHPKILRQYGGVYDDVRVTGYVATVGGRIAANSDTPGAGFRFTVLDSPIVNAFALPGGYIYVTRGLVALANSEAELASVLAHEIGHVTARHSAQQYNRAMGMSIGSAVLGALIGNQVVSNLINRGGELYLLNYSRSQEYEADQLGLRFLSRAGYDPYAAADFLRNLEAQDTLESTLNPAKNTRPIEFLSTHPQTAKRVQEAIERARATGLPVQAMPRLAEAFFSNIDGMTYGDSAEQGFARGRDFLHPKERFAFTVPPEFRIINTPEAVIAEGPQETKIRFDTVRPRQNLTVDGYLTRVWAKNINLRNLENLNVNGMPGATGETEIQTQQGWAVLRLLVIGFTPERMARIMILSPGRPSAALAQELRRFTYSLRQLSPQEAAALQPQRLKIIRVKPGDSIAGFAAQMPFQTYRDARFRVLNGLPENASLRPGTALKLVVQ